MRHSSRQPTAHVKIERNVVSVPEDRAMQTIEESWNKPSWSVDNYNSDIEEIEPPQKEQKVDNGEPAYDWKRSFVVRLHLSACGLY